jgi:DNA invertase Pin-like site-specific DNA recombinase
MTIYAYARVSTGSQPLDAQEAALLAAGATKVFSEKISGAVTERRRWPRQSLPLALAMSCWSLGWIGWRGQPEIC